MQENVFLRIVLLVSLLGSLGCNPDKPSRSLMQSRQKEPDNGGILKQNSGSREITRTNDLPLPHLAIVFDHQHGEEKNEEVLCIIPVDYVIGGYRGIVEKLKIEFGIKDDQFEFILKIKVKGNEEDVRENNFKWELMEKADVFNQETGAETTSYPKVFIANEPSKFPKTSLSLIKKDEKAFGLEDDDNHKKKNLINYPLQINLLESCKLAQLSIQKVFGYQFIIKSDEKYHMANLRANAKIHIVSLDMWFKSSKGNAAQLSLAEESKIPLKRIAEIDPLFGHYAYVDFVKVQVKIIGLNFVIKETGEIEYKKNAANEEHTMLLACRSDERLIVIRRMVNNFFEIVLNNLIATKHKGSDAATKDLTITAFHNLRQDFFMQGDHFFIQDQSDLKNIHSLTHTAEKTKSITEVAVEPTETHWQGMDVKQYTVEFKKKRVIELTIVCNGVHPQYFEPLKVKVPEDALGSHLKELIQHALGERRDDKLFDAKGAKLASHQNSDFDMFFTRKHANKKKLDMIKLKHHDGKKISYQKLHEALLLVAQLPADDAPGGRNIYILYKDFDKSSSYKLEVMYKEDAKKSSEKVQWLQRHWFSGNSDSTVKDAEVYIRGLVNQHLGERFGEEVEIMIVDKNGRVFTDSQKLNQAETSENNAIRSLKVLIKIGKCKAVIQKGGSTISWFPEKTYEHPVEFRIDAPVKTVWSMVYLAMKKMRDMKGGQIDTYQDPAMIKIPSSSDAPQQSYLDQNPFHLIFKQNDEATHERPDDLPISAFMKDKHCEIVSEIWDPIADLNEHPDEILRRRNQEFGFVPKTYHDFGGFRSYKKE